MMIGILGDVGTGLKTLELSSWKMVELGQKEDSWWKKCRYQKVKQVMVIYY